MEGKKENPSQIHEWKCPICGKRMVSLYPAQLESWKHFHLTYKHPSK